MPEKPTPWCQLAEGDEVWSDKAGRWFTVRSCSTKGNTTRVRFEGVAKPFDRPARDEVPARRGPTGEAVDTIITVMWSG